VGLDDGLSCAPACLGLPRAADPSSARLGDLEAGVLHHAARCSIVQRPTTVLNGVKPQDRAVSHIRDRAVSHIRMAGTQSGVPVEQTMWQAVKLREGKLSWWASYRTEAEALEAVGLSE
jgi:hypothetical protein